MVFIMKKSIKDKSLFDKQIEGQMTQISSMNQTRGVKNVHRVIDLLESFEQHPSGMTLSELSVHLDLPKSTVHRLLNALLDRRFVRESNPPGKYLLGYKFLHLSLAYLEGFDLYREAHPKLEELNKKIDETIILGVFDQTQHQIIYLDKIDTTKSIKLGSRVGETAPIHCTAIGKALLSGFPDDEILRILNNYKFEKFTDQTIVNIPVLLEDLSETKKRGYAIDLQEYKTNIVCVGVPILNFVDDPLAAISVSAPADRFEPSRMEIVAKLVIETAKDIGKLLPNIPVQQT